MANKKLVFTENSINEGKKVIENIDLNFYNELEYNSCELIY
jgi:hypothetical protein